MARPKGGYRDEKNKKIVGTTTVISRFKESGGLLWWAFEQGKAAERGEINSLYDKRDEAASAGTLAHDMVEAKIRGHKMPDLDKYPPSVADYAQQGYDNYLKWHELSKIKVIETEISLTSEKFRYGGTIDAIIRTTDGLAIGDWKTSSGVYVDYLLQLAAYKNLWDENFPGHEITGGFHLLRFSKEYADFGHHYWSELDDAWEQFKLFLQAYRVDKRLKKRAK